MLDTIEAQAAAVKAKENMRKAHVFLERWNRFEIVAPRDASKSDIKDIKSFLGISVAAGDARPYRMGDRKGLIAAEASLDILHWLENGEKVGDVLSQRAPIAHYAASAQASLNKSVPPDGGGKWLPCPVLEFFITSRNPDIGNDVVSVVSRGLALMELVERRQLPPRLRPSGEHTSANMIRITADGRELLEELKK